MVKIKSGTIDDFFDSALETAKEIDTHSKATHKHTIWMDVDDLVNILKPQRRDLIRYLKDKKKIYYSDLQKAMSKSPSSLNRDLELLSKYQIIAISKEPNAGHGIRKVIKPLHADDTLVFQTAI